MRNYVVAMTVGVLLGVIGSRIYFTAPGNEAAEGPAIAADAPAALPELPAPADGSTSEATIPTGAFLGADNRLHSILIELKDDPL